MKKNQLDCSPCDFDEIKHFASAASREHSSVKRASHDQWFKLTAGAYIIGCGGLLWLPNALRPQKARIRGIYVLPIHRGKGHGTFLAEWLIDKAEDMVSVTSIEAYAVNPSFYVEHGFKAGKVNGSGYPLMRKSLI